MFAEYKVDSQSGFGTGKFRSTFERVRTRLCSFIQEEQQPEAFILTLVFPFCLRSSKRDW